MDVLAIIFFSAINLVLFGDVLATLICCTTQIKAWWHSPPVVLFRLGGVTTLRRTLNYRCALCHDTMAAGDKVRTLSCGHAFHCGATVKCGNGIDQWLRTAPQMSCPLCRQTPHPVLPWKRPPPSSPATSSSDLEEALLLPVLPPPSSPAPSLHHQHRRRRRRRRRIWRRRCCFRCTGLTKHYRRRRHRHRSRHA